MQAGLYVIREARFNGEPVSRPFVIALDVEGGDVRRVTLRSEHVFGPGQTGGLEVRAARDGVLWRMWFGRVRVEPVSAVEAEAELLEPGEFERLGELGGSGRG